tara:strand:+ start:407 stop:745 length:339 start_codon:yes stop_codon:yes gene_type:complete
MIEINKGNKEIKLDDKTHQFDHRIEDGYVIDDLIIILLSPDDHKVRFGQFQNLLALNFDGNILWHAELSTNRPGDCYREIYSITPLQALSFCSFHCHIDIKTGKITKKIFYK